MAPMTAKSVKVTLRNEKEKARWKNLSPLISQPSRYPSLAVVRGLGIQSCWDTLLQEGGLDHLFRDKKNSHKELTVEFLSTLELIYGEEDGELEAISFRLSNKEFTITPAKFNDIFRLYGDEDGAIWQEPSEFNRDEFWRDITHQEDPTASYNPSRAKGSEIRNPVLRYLHKALVYLPFAHTQAGSVQSEELFVMWGLLRGIRINVGRLMIEFLERMTKKSSGKLCCGGIISSIALALGVSFVGRTPDMGPTNIDWDVLKQSRVIKVDSRGQGYFIQSDKTYIKFPNPQLFAIGGWTYRQNWKMLTEAHLEAYASDPPQGVAPANRDPTVPYHIDPPVIPEESALLEGPSHMEEDEQTTPTFERGEGSRRGGSKRKRRSAQSMEDYMKQINEGMTSLRVGQIESRGAGLQLQEQLTTFTAQYQADHQAHLQWQAQHDAYLRGSVEGITQWQMQQDAYRQADLQEAREWRAQYDARLAAYEQQQRTQWEAFEAWRSQYQPPPQ